MNKIPVTSIRFWLFLAFANSAIFLQALESIHVFFRYEAIHTRFVVEEIENVHIKRGSVFLGFLALFSCTPSTRQRSHLSAQLPGIIRQVVR
jgi:hypothetical protein